MTLLRIDDAADCYSEYANFDKVAIWKKCLLGGKRTTEDKSGEWAQTDIGWEPGTGYWEGETDDIKKDFGLSGGDCFGADKDKIGTWSNSLAAIYSIKYGLYPRYDDQECDSRFVSLNQEDGDFKTINGRWMPGGTPGIMLEGTNDTAYSKLLLPAYELTADHNSKDGKYLTPVYDVKEDGSLDRDRNASLNILWVKENDKKTFQLAWNHKKAEHEDIGWGFYVSKGLPGTKLMVLDFAIDAEGRFNTVVSATKRTKKKKIKTIAGKKKEKEKATLAYSSWLRNGPWHPGCEAPGEDKHFIWKTADGEAGNSGHLDTEAYFFWDAYFDAPINFQKRTMPPRQHFPYLSYVHFVYDPDLTHNHETGSKPGRWDLYCEVPQYPARPPYEPVPGLIDPFYRGEPINTDKSFGRIVPGEPKSMGQMREQGQETQSGSTGQTNRASPGIKRFGSRTNNKPKVKVSGGQGTTPEQAAARMKAHRKRKAEHDAEYRRRRKRLQQSAGESTEPLASSGLVATVDCLPPVMWNITNLAKFATHKYDYTQTCKNSTWEGGTVGGTAYITPPEFLGDSFVIPTDTPTNDNYSQIYYGFHPSIDFGWGIPAHRSIANRHLLLRDGAIFSMTGATGVRDLDLKFYDAATPGVQRAGTFSVKGTINATTKVCLLDDIPITFGNTCAVPDALIDWDTSLATHSLNLQTISGHLRFNPYDKIEHYYSNKLITREPIAGAPTVAVGGAGVLNGNYRYCITFVTATGETSPGSKSGNVAPAGNKVDLTNIPTGTGAVLARKIYRTDAGGSYFYMKYVDIINDNTTTTYEDNIADGALGAYHLAQNTTGGITYAGANKLVQVDDGGLFMGVDAGKNQHVAVFPSMFIGYKAGGKGDITTAYLNIGIGSYTLYPLTTGYNNLAFGNYVLYKNTVGESNTGVGGSSLYENVDGNKNTAVGVNALQNNVSGHWNAAIGHSSLRNTTGHGNTGAGYYAGKDITGGSYNSVFGYNAGENIGNRVGNNCFGRMAGWTGGGNYCIFMGYEAGYFETGHNKLMFDYQKRGGENAERIEAIIYGIMAAAPANQHLHVNANLYTPDDLHHYFGDPATPDCNIRWDETNSEMEVNVATQDADFHLTIMDAAVQKDAIFVDADVARIGLWNVAPTVELDLTGSQRITAQFDVEGYSAFGNGSALNADCTMIVDRDFTGVAGAGVGILRQLYSTGIITSHATGHPEIYHNHFAPSGSVLGVNATLVSSVVIGEPVITLGGNTATEAASLTIDDAPTEGVINYGLLLKNGARTYNDVYMALESGRQGGANQPTWAVVTGNLHGYAFAIGDYIEPDSCEIPHSYNEGTDLEVHVHIVIDGAEAGGDVFVNYEVEYTWGDYSEVMSAAALVTSGDYTIPNGTADRTHFTVPIDIIAGAGYRIGSMFKCRFRRVALVNPLSNDPANDPFVLMVGLHVLEDSTGSHGVYTKN